MPGSHFSAHGLLHGLAFLDRGVSGREHHRVDPIPAAVDLLDRRDGEVDDPLEAFVAFIVKNADDLEEDAVDADVLSNGGFVLEELIAYLDAHIGHFPEFT